MNPIPITSLSSWLWSSPATVQCGFPSPAEDHHQERLNLNTLIVQHPDATFFMRVRGESMKDADIDDGDYVVVDRSIEPKHGHIVVAVIDGEFTIKRLHLRPNAVCLLAANPLYSHIELKSEQELHIWGVVTWTLKKHLRA